ncbi:MAG: hypothetical protein RMY16_12145 [Nostoc sp. DedQUE12b]|uniref:hypothetical protein n=1 Tax=unclassified Nostoc TaxID=2593658 RepID=UPI002AD557A0|nr:MULTISPECIES: hypothetical protein [unclassified Nostoc]MDZ7955191.1 hypothetical protein [Nostoc sp. DedQUE09]MDZ8086295.1 hypothetical protein [Nostoc sp. DedQUE12b]
MQSYLRNGLINLLIYNSICVAADFSLMELWRYSRTPYTGNLLGRLVASREPIYTNYINSNV